MFLWLFRGKNRLDLVAGLCDGILTALILAGGKLLYPDSPLDVDLSLRVASAAAVSGAFVFFMAHYAELRGELVHAERQLTLLSHGHFAATRLGRAVLRDAFGGALVASGCTFLGALIPLLTATIPSTPAWLGVAVAIGALALLGTFLAKAVYGQPFRWALGLVLAGLLITFIGLQIRII
jgi:predicted membrane protein (TIGR00267 family)